MVKVTLVLMLFLGAFGRLWAEDLAHSEKILFNGQTVEEFLLGNEKTETRYRTELQDSTCEREVPYQETVCEMVPRYDQVCHTIPGRNDCHTEYDRQCRDVTRYRTECHRTPDDQQCRTETRYKKECHRGPSRRECRNVTHTRQRCRMDHSNRQCHTEPAREQCRTTASGERRCRQIPAREVCENKPVRVCEDVRETERVCDTVPGELECRQVPYQERVCHTIPGEQVCRDVPYTDTECENVPREECSWIPSREECETVQVGEEQVCRDETRYRTEQYACQIEVQVPYSVTLEEYRAKCLFNFDSENYSGNFEFETKLTENGEIVLESLASKGEVPVIFVDRKVERTQQDKLQDIQAVYNLKLLSEEHLNEVLFPAKEFNLTKENLVFKLPLQNYAAKMKINLSLMEEGRKLVAREMKEEEVEFKKMSDHILVSISMKDLKIEIEGFHRYDFKIMLTPIFSEPLAFPEQMKVQYKTSGELNPELTEDDLEKLRLSLEHVSGVSYTTDELQFTLADHELIQDVGVSLKIDNLINRDLRKGEFSYARSRGRILVKIPVGNLNLKLNARKENSIQITGKYLFKDDSQLPSDFTVFAKRELSLKPTLTKSDFAKIEKQASEISNVEIHRKAVEFQVVDSDYLKGLTLKLHLQKGSKVQLNKIIAEKDLKIIARGGKLKVYVDLNKYGVKLSRFRKTKASLEVSRELSPDLRSDQRKIFKAKTSVTVKAN